MTQLTLDCFDKIDAPMEETFLYPPSDTDEIVEKPPRHDPEESSFKVIFRPMQFCN